MNDNERGPGRPLLLLNEGVQAQVLEAIRCGLTVRSAAQAAGIGERTLYRWLSRGRQADERAAAGESLAGVDLMFRQFWQASTRAHAQGEARAAQQLRQLMAGGYVVKTRTRHYRDKATGQLVQQVEQDLAPPNVRAVIFYLERRHPQTWGRNAQPATLDEGPPAWEADTSLRAAAKRVREVRERFERMKELETTEGPDGRAAVSAVELPPARPEGC